MKNLIYAAAAVLIILASACSSKNDAKNADKTNNAAETTKSDQDKVNYVEQRKDSVANLEFLGYKVNEFYNTSNYDYDKAPVKDMELVSGKKLKMKCFSFLREYYAPNRYVAYNADVNKEQIMDVLNTFIDKYGAFTYCFHSVGKWVKDIHWGYDGRYHPAMWYADTYAGFVYDKTEAMDDDTVPDYSQIKNALYYSNYFKKNNSNKEALKAIMADADASLNECISTEMYGYTDGRTFSRRPFMTFVWEWKNQAAEVMVSHDVVCVTYINAGYDFRKLTGRLLSDDEKKAEMKTLALPYTKGRLFYVMSKDDAVSRIQDPNMRDGYIIGTIFGDIRDVNLIKAFVKDIYMRQSEKEIRVVVVQDFDSEFVVPAYDIRYDGKKINAKKVPSDLDKLPDIK